MITTIDLNEIKLVSVTMNHVVVSVGCRTIVLSRNNGLKKCVFCGCDFKPKRVDSCVCDKCKPKYYKALSVYKRLCFEKNFVSVNDHGLVFSKGVPDYMIRKDGSMKVSYWYLYQLLIGAK